MNAVWSIGGTNGWTNFLVVPEFNIPAQVSFELFPLTQAAQTFV